MTDKHKLELAIAQAQKRGWKEGWKYKLDAGIWYMFEDVLFARHYLSLNDILFGTDFCEKLFKQKMVRDCTMACSVGYIMTDSKHYKHSATHIEMMLSMSESERIEFLYKHVEGEEEQYKMTEGQEKYVDEWNKRLMSYKEFEEKLQPIEAKEIEELPTNWRNEYFETIALKINELVDQVNANTKDIRDCKLNRD